mgnify:CR=1 FL=1
MATVEKIKSAYDILVEASESAEQAIKDCRPTPIVVGSPSTPLGNDVDPTQQTWFVEGGVCGFASIVIKPARGNIVAELKKRNRLTGKARKFHSPEYPFAGE